MPYSSMIMYLVIILSRVLWEEEEADAYLVSLQSGFGAFSREKLDLPGSL